MYSNRTYLIKYTSPISGSVGENGFLKSYQSLSLGSYEMQLDNLYESLLAV